jgi:hypothetical protein
MSGPLHPGDDPVPSSRVGKVRSSFDWAFRDRNTSRVILVQFPNLSLGIFLVASLIRRKVHLIETPRAVLGVVVALSLGLWAVDEIILGVNPWRRILGAAVLVLFIIGRLSL